MKAVMISVIGGRAVLVGKSYQDIPDELLLMEEYDEDLCADCLIDEETWESVKEFNDSESQVMSFMKDEFDMALGRSEEDYKEMKEALRKIFVEEYKSEDLWIKIEDRLDSMEWGEKAVFV